MANKKTRKPNSKETSEKVDDKNNHKNHSKKSLKTRKKRRILTGDNATGDLHMGHLVGSLENRVKLQDKYETFIIIADLHAFAYPKYVENPEIVSEGIMKVAIGNLAAGINPEKSVIFAESTIPEIFQLSTILSNLVSHNRVMRNPTVKDEIRDKEMGDNYSLGFINFPVLMAADILSVRSDLVPVGEDQLPHLELTREIARRFNNIYGETFYEPEPLTGRVARLVGTDGGAKMTKTLNNTIYLSEKDDDLKQKIFGMYTDPNRIRATDPGTVEGNPVFIYHDTFNKNIEEVKDLKERYRKGKVGDVEVKEKLYLAIKQIIDPIRDKYEYYQSNMNEVEEILRVGTETIRKEAKETMDLVKERMKLPTF